MFGKKEKWEERKDKGEKWRENKKLGCLVEGKNREKRKLERRKNMWGPPKTHSPKLERKYERKLDWL